LQKIPNRRGDEPDDSIHPANIAQLVVSGAEKNPDRTTRVVWSRRRSEAFLQFYDEGYTTEASQSSDDGDGTLSEGEMQERQEREASKTVMSARRCRLRVAKYLGVTVAQINYAQTEL